MAVLRTINSRNYPSGQRTITSANIPAGYRTLKFTFTDETWPAGFVLSAAFEASPDNGTTWNFVGGFTAEDGWVNPITGLPEPRWINVPLGFVSTTQTSLRGTFTASQSFNTEITIEGFA